MRFIDFSPSRPSASPESTNPKKSHIGWSHCALRVGATALLEPWLSPLRMMMMMMMMIIIIIPFAGLSGGALSVCLSVGEKENQQV